MTEETEAAPRRNDGGSERVLAAVALALALVAVVLGAMGAVTAFVVWQSEQTDLDFMVNRVERLDTKVETIERERTAEAARRLESQRELDRLAEAGRTRDRRLDDLDDDLDDVHDAHTTTERAIEDLAQSLDEETGALAEDLAGLTEGLNALEETLGKERLEWHLAEAEYLAGIASRRLQLDRDVAGAVVALRAAADQLARTERAAFADLQNAVAREAQRLADLELPDLDGWRDRLRQFEDRAVELPLAERLTPVAEPAPPEAEPNTWQEAVNRVWQELRSLVVVHRLDDRPVAMLSQEEQFFLRQNLRLELASARHGLNIQDNDAFHAALERVGVLLGTYFDTDDETVAAIQETLAEWQEAVVFPELPDLAPLRESIAASRAELRERAAGGNS